MALGRHHADPGPLGRQGGQVVGCTADDKGNIYLANLASKIGGSFPLFNETPFDGSIVKVSPDLRTSYLAQGLNYPTGITLGLTITSR